MASTEGQISSLLFEHNYLKIHKYFHFRRHFCAHADSALSSCRNLQNVKQIHACNIVSNGQEPPFIIASKLSSLYISFNDFNSSVSILKAMKEPSTFLWNSLIKALVYSDLIESALFVYKTMRKNGVSCDGYTFPILNKLILLSECGGISAEMIHCVSMQMGFESDVYFCNTMIEAYVKSGYFGNALKLFDEMTYRDSVSWTSMISGYASKGNADGAFQLFSEMRKDMEPNAVTMIVMLQTCSTVTLGRQFHGYTIKCGFLIDHSLKNSILKMYADFGSIDDSKTLFDEILARNVVSWNILISLYSSKGMTTEMIGCFNTMRIEVEPTIETLTLLISGLKECADSCPGTQIHCLAFKFGLFDNMFESNLLDFYAKSGDLSASSQLFKELSLLSCNTWGSMISLLITCANQGALRFGKAIHAYSIKILSRYNNDEVRILETSVVNMYVRSGSISYARICFDKARVKDLVTWSSMIEGYATHGLGTEAFKLFSQMKSDGIEPNSATFLSLLSACSHSGLLHEGIEVLNSMTSKFGIEPDIDHYTCVVDLLGRSGKIKEALSIILKLVSFPDSRIWAALLSAARIHKDHKIGNYAAEKLLLDHGSDNVGYYTMFSNVQASLEKWDEVEEVRSGMKDMNLIKYPGSSRLEVKGVFHGFVSGDRSHCQTDEIYPMIECLSRNALRGGIGIGTCSS